MKVPGFTAENIRSYNKRERWVTEVEKRVAPLALARAREQLKSAQWDLERVLKRIFGPSAELTGKDGGPISIEIVRYGSQIIEGAVQHEPSVRSAPLLIDKNGQEKP